MTRDDLVVMNKILEKSSEIKKVLGQTIIIRKASFSIFTKKI